MSRDALDAGDGLAIVDLRRCFIVVNKPAGLASVPGLTPSSQDNLWVRVCQHLPEASGPMVCHRLDVPTSGLMVLALDADAHRHLSMQFDRRTVWKRYLAVVDVTMSGEPSGEQMSGTVDLPLRPDFAHRPWQMVDRFRGRPALTRWWWIASELGPGPSCRRPAGARLLLEPVTGRTHQLRVHLAHPAEDGGLGCPILGDDLYGDAGSAPRLCLHAAGLGFEDPETGERVRYWSEPPF